MKTVKTYSPKTKILSLILSFLIIFYLVPASVFAEGLDNDITVSDNSVSANEENNTYTPEIYEVTELREENVKHFRLEDGSYVAAQYNYPVHYTDENGEFTDINNRLEEGAGGEYSNSNTRVSFVKKITGSGKLFTFAEDDVEVSISVLNANKGIYGSVTNCEDSEEFTELQKKMNLENLSSKVLYEEVFDGVDIEYVVQSLDIKENIIVKERSDEYTYSFEIKLKNLTPTLADDGSILLSDNEGTAKYIIPAPVVYDAAYTFAEDGIANYSLEGKNNKYTLTVTVDPEWMNSESTLFPVTVDPTIVATSHGVINQQIPSLMCVRLKAPLTMKLSDVPSLPSSSVMTSATLSLAYKGSGGFFVPRLILSDTVSNSVFDIDNRSGLNMYVWNVTELIRQWYINSWSSHSLTVSIYNEMETMGLDVPIWLMPASSDFLNINSPTFELSYAISSGIEDYYSYSSHSLVNAGNGSVNLATGNLTFISDLISTTDHLMPITLSAVYNSDLAGKDYTINNSHSAYVSSYMPYGYKLNISETIIEKTMVNEDGTTMGCYILSDGDGTEHYFYFSGYTYVDDSALGRTLSVGTNEITITYKDHSVKTFTKMSSEYSLAENSWVLSKITDSVGNAIIITFNEGYIPSKISLLPFENETAIDMVLFTYNNGKLRSLYSPASQYLVGFNYSNNYNDETLSSSGNYLRKIEYAIGPVIPQIYSSTVLNYDENGNILSINDTKSNQSFEYQWDSYKVSKITHFGEQECGQSVTFDYGNGFTDVMASGNDENISTIDDNLSTRYIYDNLGRVVRAFSFASNGSEIYSATTGKYDTQHNSKNSIKETMVTGGNSANYLLNNGFEIGMPTYWSTSNLLVFMINSPTATGNYCIRILPRESGEGSITQNAYLESGNYNLSMKYKTSDIDESSTSIYLRVTNRDGTVITQKKVAIDTANTAENFITASMSFEIDQPQIVSVAIVIDSENGDEMIVDDIMLEKGTGMSNYSLIQGGNFDYTYRSTSSDNPMNVVGVYWDSESGGTLKIETVELPFGGVAKVSNDSIKQTLFNNISITNLSPSYCISGFAYASSLTGSGDFCLAVNVYYYQGEDVEDVCITYEYDFVHLTETWQYISGVFNSVPSADKIVNASANYDTISKIEVVCEYSGQAENAFAYFDNISLTELVADSTNGYLYDNSGNLIATQSLYNNTYYEYDDENNVTRIANNLGEIYDYTYNEFGQPVTETYKTFTWGDSTVYPFRYVNINSLISTTTIYTKVYTYNDYGMLESIVTTSADDENESLTITKTYQLDEDSKIFGALLESTDASGIITKYMYDTNNGRLLATLTGSYGVAYTYDTWGRMIKATPATVSGNSYSSINNAENVAYSYDDKGNLSSISTDTTTYTLTYDEFGNTTEIEAGDNTLATYEYNDYNGKLCKIVYGNGLIVEYIYNSLELLEKICYTYSNGTTETITEYTYTRDGNLHSVKDFKSSSTTVYEYDSIGRVSGSYKYSEFEDSNAETTLSEGFIYDGSNGRLSSSNHRWVYLSGSIRYNVEHQYDYVYNQDGTLCQSNVSVNGDSSSVTNMLVNYEYDYLKRPDKITYISGDYIIRSEEFGYTTQGTTNGALTGMIESYTSSVASNTTTYVYSYDSRGNITKIVVGDKEIRYTYDDLGQLTREENEILNQSFAYTYDDAGNIKSKKVCNLTTGAVARNNDYYYSSSAWGDRLTAFGGTGQITYDAIGNPLTYNNGTTYHFTWEGRNLTRVYTSGYATHFIYNSDGIRTARYSDNGSRTEFILNGSQILAEVSEDSVIAYIYDANGSPIGMQHRLTTYTEDVWDIFWFDKNLQGDIVAVYNEYGVKCVSYTYDAWGNSRVTTHDETGTNKYATKNSFRYRGYYYDRTISMYYLNSRYYDPITCRFINADGYVSTGQGLTGYNMFAYCNNNPVNYVDYSGESAFGIVLLILLGVGVLGVLTSCDNPDANDIYDTYGDVGDVLGFVDDSVQFAEDLQAHNYYKKSYCIAVSQYYQTNQPYWDEYLNEAFSGNQERCMDLVEGDIILLKTAKKEHLPYINDVDYLYEHFNDWAYYGRTGIVGQSAAKPAESGLKWYQDIWGFISGFAN